MGELRDKDLLSSLRYKERKYGISSAEFYRRWLTLDFDDTFETNCWAMQYRQASELGLMHESN